MTVNSWRKGGIFTSDNFLWLILILLLATMSAPAKGQQAPPRQAGDTNGKFNGDPRRLQCAEECANAWVDRRQGH